MLPPLPPSASTAARQPARTLPARPAVASEPCDSLHPNADVEAARERANQRYGKIPGVQIQVVTVAGSSKPVVVLRSSLGTGPPKVQVHFHGDQYLDAKVGYDRRIGPTIAKAWGTNPDLVFVIPESNNENAGPRVDWSDVSNFGEMTRQALTSAGVDPDKVGEKILSGHSAGGSPVARAIASDPPSKGYEIKDFNRIELYDAAVGSTLNPVSDAERTKISQWTGQHPQQFLYVPGVITDSAWLKFIDPSRLTKPAADHFSALWDSLGQERSPGSS